MQPTFSLAYTTIRPAYVAKVVKTWNDRSSLKAHEWVVSLDGNRADCVEAARQAGMLLQQAGKGCAAYKAIVQKEPPYNCVRGWNLAASQTTGKIIITVADDFMPPENWDTQLLAVRPGWEDGEFVVKVEDGYVHDIFVLSILTRKRYEKFGYVFYPQYESMFCLPLSTPILMANWSMKALAHVQKGHKIIGSERRFGARGQGEEKRNFLTQTEVKATTSRKAETVLLSMESGREFICTPDHVWACYGGARDYERDASGKLVKMVGRYLRQSSAGRGTLYYDVAAVGRRLVRVELADDIPTGLPDNERELGWLAGLYDGEGSFPVISQSETHNPAVCAEIERLLTKYGFSFSTDRSQVTFSKEGVEQRQKVYTLTGGRKAYARFLGIVRPVRCQTAQVEKRMLTSRFGVPDRIVAIRVFKPMTVMCLTTTTQNYVASGYLSHNCDTEFGEVAKRDGVVINAQHLLFEHLHPDCQKRQRDAADLSHASKERWNRGEMLFNTRKAMNFPLDSGPTRGTPMKVQVGPSPHPGTAVTIGQPGPAPVSAAPAVKAEYCAYLQVTKNDFCLEEVCDRLREEGVNTFFMAIPDEYWFTKASVPDEEVAQVEAVATSQRSKGATVHTKRFDVSTYRFPGDALIVVEARLRNDSLSWIRSHGFDRILIVDGDELWFRGILSAIDACVREGAQSVSCRMVPVIGFPGYPVDKATDLAVVYIGGTAVFHECRTPRISPMKLPMPMVFHFTATRRTMEEIAAKMRVGGHYDDKDYLFDEWIEKVLPHIKPGFQHTWPSGHKGLHMYNPYQIWPNVRNWRPEELVQIPSSLHPFLAINPA